MANTGWCLTMKGSNEVVSACNQKHKSRLLVTKLPLLLSKCLWLKRLESPP